VTLFENTIFISIKINGLKDNNKCRARSLNSSPSKKRGAKNPED